MPIDRISPPPTDRKEVSPAEKVAALVKNYESAQVAPDGAVAFTLKPHVERDRMGRVVDSYKQEDVVPQGEVFLLMQAGHSENLANPDSFPQNESHRAVLAHIIPTASGVTVEYAYITLGQKVESLSVESVLDAFKTNPGSVVYGTSEASPTEMGSRPHLWRERFGMLKDEKGIGDQPPIDRRGVFASTTTIVEKGQVKTTHTDIELGLPYEISEKIFGYQMDDTILETRVK